MAAPYPVFYDSADAAAITAAITSTKNAGDTVAAVQYNLWNDKAAAVGSTTLTNAHLLVEAFDGTNWLRSGLPCLDEGWVKASITGKNNTGDSTMVDQTTGYYPLGASRFLPLSDIPKNCARYVSVKIDIPNGAATGTPDIRLIVEYDEVAIPLSSLAALYNGSGIIPERLDPNTRKFTSFPTVTTAGTAVVTVAERFADFNVLALSSKAGEGTPYYWISTTATLNQTAADGALAVGQSYIAVLSQSIFSAGITTTKGNKGASPTAPATPTGELFVAYVTVAYQGGGTSIINAGNVDQSAVLVGGYGLWAGTGLTLNIGSGRALSNTDIEMVNTAHSTISTTNNATRYLFLYPDGTFALSTSTNSDTAGAVYLGSVVAAAGAITTVTSAFADASSNTSAVADHALTEWPMVLRHRGPLSVATDLDWAVLPFNAILERVDVHHATAGVTGSTIYDINFRAAATGFGSAGTTFYTSQATSDQRPTLATTVVSSGNLIRHEVRAVAKGARISFDCDAVSTTAPIDVELVLHWKRYQF